MEIKEKAIYAADFLDSRKAADITIIDIAEKSGFADYFVIATAGSLRQLEALSGDLEDKMAEQSWLAHHVEGKGDTGWILLDFGDIIVNLFTEEQRNHYNLEKLWSDCITIDYEPSKD